MLNQYKETFKRNKNVVFYDQEEYYIRVKEDVNDDWDAEDEFEETSLDDIDDSDIDFDEGGEF